MATGEFQRRQEAHTHPHGVGGRPQETPAISSGHSYNCSATIVSIEGEARSDPASGKLTPLPQVGQFEIYVVWRGGFAPAKKEKKKVCPERKKTRLCGVTRPEVANLSKGLRLLPRSPDEAVGADVSKLLPGAERRPRECAAVSVTQWGHPEGVRRWRHGAETHTKHPDTASDSGKPAL